MEMEMKKKSENVKALKGTGPGNISDPEYIEPKVKMVPKNI